jgi:uncharacterized protein YlzI (FlbEa/FlbD family)
MIRLSAFEIQGNEKSNIIDIWINPNYIAMMRPSLQNESISVIDLALPMREYYKILTIKESVQQIVDKIKAFKNETEN